MRPPRYHIAFLTVKMKTVDSDQGTWTYPVLHDYYVISGASFRFKRDATRALKDYSHADTVYFVVDCKGKLGL